MSSRSRKAREKLRPVEPAPVDNSLLVDAWVPDYGRQCEVCGQSPCVTGVRAGKVVYHGSMCGVCTWGDSACIDPANW
ncbi:hypothetical protein QFZ94_007506 [Paraburkholderia sp. JPY465]|uniref:hypothetical protein n=1 Tax=Paraburkholderia sp. JPY465 TaxID=3042285 RepID=UPI003D21A1D7